MNKNSFIDGIDAAIKILEKYKENHVVIILIIRELEKMKKDESRRVPY